MGMIMASSVADRQPNCIVLFRRLRLIQRDTNRAEDVTFRYKESRRRHWPDTSSQHHVNRAMHIHHA